MTRQNTYDKYRSGKAARDARNTSEGKKSFIRMKQKFLSKETAVPSEGNFAHLSGSYRPACKLFALIAVLLLLGANWNGAMGQTYTIVNNDEENGPFPHKNLPTLVDTVYVDNNETYRLITGNYEYYWYFRWYRREGESATNISGLAPTTWNGVQYLLNEGNGRSYFWAYNIKDMPRSNVFDEQKDHRYVASIDYTGNGQLDSVFCDVSFNIDEIGILGEYDRDIQEPTIGKRYKFIIKPAEEMRKRLANVKEGEAMETIHITVPDDATNVNLLMNLEPESYYWDSHQGNRFKYEIYGDNATSPDVTDYTITSDDAYKAAVNGPMPSRRFITIDNVSTVTTVKVYANTGPSMWNEGENSPCITQFILTPQSESTIAEEGSVTENRDPANDTQKYKQIGAVDFDMDATRSSISKDNNWRDVPLDWWNTSYSFASPELPWINYWDGDYPPSSWGNNGNRAATPEDSYGLYRTANVLDLDEVPFGNVQDYYYSKSRFGGKEYGWYVDNVLYDRTYERTSADNTQETRYGYFYYLNASKEAGRIMNVDLQGTLCPNTELVVTAWVANMSNGATPPNLTLMFRGEKKNENGKTESVVLHRFSTGNTCSAGIKDKTSSGDPGVWKQLYYRITLNADIASYSNFSVEVYNNTEDSGGADYAIDDIRVFCTLPDIHVERFDACDANTLTINTEYETILGNMGWTAGEEVQVSADRPTRFNQYGYGLPTETENGVTKHYYGNIYFAFLEGLEDNDGNITAGEDKTNLDWATKEKLGQDIEPRELAAGSDYRWVRVNRNLTNPSYQSVYSFRVAVPTQRRLVKTSEQEALEQEKRWNFQAVIDFNNDNEKKTGYGDVDDTDGWAFGRADMDDIPDIIDIKRNAEGEYEVVHESGLIMLGEFTADDIVKPENEELYTKLGEELYKYLQIPRIRCPWLDEEGRLCLYEMNVEYTDMMFEGEPYTDAGGNQRNASGDYHVMIFSGEQISKYPTPTAVVPEAIADDCSLISAFTVYGRIIIRIEADPDVNARACAGTMRKISASLVNHEDGSELEAGYSFDWYMGSLENYKTLTIATNSLQDALVTFRDATDYTGDPYEALENWPATGDNAAIKEKLLELVNSNLLVIDALEFEWNVACAQIVAIPFMKGGTENTLYCFDVQTADVPEYEADVPYLHPGFNNLFKGEVALRLGHPNMAQALAVPLRDDFTITGVEDEAEREKRALGIPEAGVDIKLNRVSDNYPIVGTAQSFRISNADTDAKLTITLNADAKNILEEGESYELLIPFVQYEDGVQLTNECDGQIVLPVKIVPEYLTWTGNGSVWYNDESSWALSTKEELYNKSDVTNETEGVYTFSPLYFTKITVSDGKGLTLYDEASQNSIGNNTALDFSEMEISEGTTTTNIQYDMAVYSKDEGKTVSVEPYYGNLVSEVFFKPNATMLNQQYLDYQKAWVEFTLERNKPYWMASPLKAVYAGDMYAPYETGEQGTETPAFEDITFSYEEDSPYHRWELPFYQKAWNKEVAYSKIVDPYTGTPNAGDIISVDAVKSNWSIEYNDVWVPYTIGKGFYMRVDEKEGDAVTVRLPKADSDYIYQVTKAGLSGKGDRTNAGRLATTLNDGIVEVDLKKVYGETASDVGESEARHFLVGNPYMTYLNMAKFLEVNSGVLNDSKYWTLANGAPSAVVGTPDVEFSGENGTFGSVSGTVKPMEAFFIEVKAGTEDTNLKVTFTPEMMSSSEITATAETRSYSATNPTLTITAERGETRSVAKLLTSDKAENGYRASEDAVVLLDSELDAPMVYTVAGSRAAQVNAVKKISNIGLGVYNAGDDEATLTISGISRMATPLYLYDAATRQSTRLEGDSYELRVSGDSHGRYFLRDAELGDELENTISIYSARPGEVIVSSLRPVKDIRVFALNGSQVRRFSVNTTRYTFTLPAGIYLIQATDGERGQTEKVLVR